jgi:glycosyltransferase involved in cell wall biosynthesis
MELPIISTKVGGMSEVIENGKNGMLIEEMKPDEIADSLIYLIQNREIAKRLGEQARESVTTGFSLTHQTEVFLKQYEKLRYEHKA